MNEKIPLPSARAGKALLIAALSLSLLLPVCLILTELAKFRPIFVRYFVITWLNFLLITGAACLLWKTKQPTEKSVGWMAAVLLPVSLLNGLCCLIEIRDSATFLGAAACFLAAIPLFARLAKTCRFKWVFGVLTAVTVALVLVLLPSFLLGYLLMGERTVIASVRSPEGAYVAELISDDQGALGGNTLVEVYRPNRTVQLYFVRLEDSPRRVYYGDYDAYTTMTLTWQDEHTLLIGEEAFSIP